MADFKCVFYLVLVLPGNVGTQLWHSCKFCNSFVEYRFMFPLVQKHKNCSRIVKVIVKNKVAPFLWHTVYNT